MEQNITEASANIVEPLRRASLMAPPASDVAIAAFLCGKDFWLAAWERLDDVLEGRIEPYASHHSLANRTRESLRALAVAASRKQTYHNLCFPVHQNEAGRLSEIIEALDSVFGKPLSSSHYPQTTKKKRGPDDLVQGHITDKQMVASAALSAGIKMTRQENDLVSGRLHKLRPLTWGVATELVRDTLADVRARTTCQDAFLKFVSVKHGVPFHLAEPKIRLIMSDPSLNMPLSNEDFERLIAPVLHALVEQTALERGTAEFHRYAEAVKFGFFEEDLRDGETEMALKAKDMPAAMERVSYLRTQGVKAKMQQAVGTDDFPVVWQLAVQGNHKPESFLRGLMPVLGKTLTSVAKAVAVMMGLPKEEAALFATAISKAAEARRAIEVAEAKRVLEWQRSLLGIKEAMAFLEAKETEFRRWVGENRIPVARQVFFHKWGQTMTANEYDPAVLFHLKGRMLEWRAEHASALSSSRRAAAKARKPIAAKTVNPNIVRKRRLAGLLRSAGLEMHAFGVPQVRVPMDLQVVERDIPAVALMFDPPAEVRAILRPDAELPKGRARKEIIEFLTTRAEAASQALRLRLETVVTDWNARVQVARTVGGDAIAFDARLESEVNKRFINGGADRGTEADVVRALERILDDGLKAVLPERAKGKSAEELRRITRSGGYPAYFPLARTLKRRLVFHVGPTNSGKTHAAMDILAAADSGCYLAPLRLMALENAERMNEERGVPCDLVTGEEIRTIEGARHVSSTIEMMNPERLVDVAVIDEVQLLGDRERGWAWTQAVVGAPARTIIMTGSADAVPFLERIAEMTGEALEVVPFERKGELVALPKVVSLQNVKAGDAVVAFSRGEVLRLREELAAQKLQVSVIYGALGPEVRRTQAARFRSGEADVLVATDAIGMGLNLPIRRVLFSALSKYDGVSNRSLHDSEIRQIGGRAGRFGLAERGEVGVVESYARHGAGNPLEVARALSSTPHKPNDLRLFVMPNWVAVQEVSRALATEDLVAILRHATQNLLALSPELRSPSTTDVMAIAASVARSGLPLRDRFRYVGCPLNADADGKIELLREWSSEHGAGRVVEAPSIDTNEIPDTGSELAGIEQHVKVLTAYSWLALRWPDTYAEGEAANIERGVMNGLIDAALRRKNLGRGCRECGERLPRHHEFAICEGCFEGRRGRRWY